jgi:hypothetical protein
MQCRCGRRARLLIIFDHMLWLCFPGVVQNALDRGFAGSWPASQQEVARLAMAWFHCMASRSLSSCRGQLRLLLGLTQHLAHQKDLPPLLRPLGMPEWDKRKAPWNASMRQVGQEQGSSSSGQQLLPATAPNMEQATEAAPNIISQLLLQDKKEDLLEHPILANTDSSPAAGKKRTLPE